MTFTFLIIFYVYMFLLVLVAIYNYIQNGISKGIVEPTSTPKVILASFLMAILWPITVPLRILTWLLVRTEV